MKNPQLRGFSYVLNDYPGGVGQTMIATVLPLWYFEFAVPKCVYITPINTHFAIASLNNCDFTGIPWVLLFKNAKQSRQREELPTCPLSASTRKACLDGNELVPDGYLSGKVGLLTLGVII